eukprot:38897_1
MELKISKIWFVMILLTIMGSESVDCDCFGCFCDKRKIKNRTSQSHINDPFVYRTPRRIRVTRLLPFEQQVVNHYCPPGTIKCILQNKNLESLQNVSFPFSIRELFLVGNHIRTLSDVLFPNGLMGLSLMQNKIVIFDHETIDLSYLHSLQVLLLDHNRIKTLKNVQLPSNLRTLSLRDNQFQGIKLGGNVPRLHRLSRLDLGMNHMNILKGNVSLLIPSSVSVLKLDMNKIESVEHVFLPFTLQRLDLSNNPLGTLDVINVKELLASGIDIRMEHNKLLQRQVERDILQLPTHVWDQSKTNVTRQCQICCEQVESGEIMRLLPCFHQYHCKCVDHWLGRSGTCPQCRHRIEDVRLPDVTESDQ